MYWGTVEKSLEDSVNAKILALAAKVPCIEDSEVVIDSTSCGGKITAHSACFNTSVWKEDNADEYRYSRRNLMQGESVMNLDAWL
jgi:hypothetical protein